MKVRDAEQKMNLNVTWSVDGVDAMPRASTPSTWPSESLRVS